MSKCIVITGAGSGLGRAIARRLGAEGHTIILLGRRLDKLQSVASELGGGCYALACDVGNPDSVRGAFASIAQHGPKIDVLINNAAIYQPFFVKDATDAQITTILMTNFAGPIYCSRAVIPMMNPGCHIINISSETVGLPYAMFSLYQSSKAGMERFTEALSAELIPSGIRVTTVRAGQMMDQDSISPAVGETARRFAEENMLRGLNLRARPISSFSSVAQVLRTLIDLPADVNVNQIILEARRPS
jgi:meso-butanediol dehydrogenase/(S,S)-butanediol dehydrogenase/diacetyl reductase